MCRECGSIKHDDRLDALAQGGNTSQDAMSISAHEQMKLEKQEEWNDLMEEWLDDPQAAASHMALGMDLGQRQKARMLAGKGGVAMDLDPSDTKGFYDNILKQGENLFSPFVVWKTLKKQGYD